MYTRTSARVPCLRRMSPSTVSQYCTGVDERHRQEEHSTAQHREGTGSSTETEHRTAWTKHKPTWGQ